VYYGIFNNAEMRVTDPNQAFNDWAGEGATEVERLLDEHLSEFEIEDLLGCDIDIDEHEDWRATDF